MKFKKVEIQAFRAYDKAEDGTFDFTHKNGGNADFISLYAPNGFGKTSFYDAVEYGITNNIDRFLRKGKDVSNSVKSERNIRANKKQYFLRNNNSEDSLPSYIKLYTVDSEKPIETIIEKPRTKAGCDYKFNPSDTKNKEFKTTILSQEWIDAFLKEDKPEDRYERFIEYFGDKKIDEYHKKLTILIALNNKKIESLKKDLSGIQLQLKFDGDKDILKKVNDKIISLNQAGEKLKEIGDRYSETDALDLSNVISERTNDLNYEIIKASEYVKYLDIFFTGNEDIEGMTKYYESKDNIEKINKQYKENSILINQFDRRQKCKNEIESLKLQNNELGTKKEILELLKSNFKEYINITKEISLKKKENDEIKKKISSSTTTLNALKQTETENTSKRSSLQNQISELEKDITDIPKLKVDFANAASQIKDTEKKRVELEQKITNSEREKSLLEILINNHKRTINEIKVGVYPSVLDSTYFIYSNIIDELTKIEELIDKEKDNLKEINSKIEANKSFQKELQLFISKGSEIINKNKSNSCPLCEQQYDSFNALASRVSSNSLLSNVISNLFKERDNKNNIITKLSESLKSKREEVAKEVSNQLEENEKKLILTSADLIAYYESRSELNKNLALYSKTLNELTLKLSGKTLEIFEIESKNLLDRLKNEYESLNKKNLEYKDLISSESLKIENARNTSTKVLVELDSLHQEVVYIRINAYFKENFPEQTIGENIIHDELIFILNRLKSNSERELILYNEIEDLNNKLNSYTYEAIQKHNELISKTKDLYLRIVNTFEQEVNSKLGIELKEYTIDSFFQLLEDRKKTTRDAINRYDLIVKDYTLLTQLKENVTPYLKYEKAKIKEKDTSARIEFLKTKISDELNNELNRVTEFLAQQIDSFFYEGLINELYRKIDPHPDYKKVAFKCDFSETKPKLNVCVYQEKEGKEDELIIPNLYFSTAQLNILSLSIFLAKALNAKDSNGKPFDCIFIDDPIQSMDSINILSTIDLIRSIVVNQKKQVILSTHDENFHNLLKKKMPSNLFNSKFMELETFGKVRNDNN